MESEGSLSHSQVPATCPYPDLDPVHTPHPTSCRFILILSSHQLLGLPSSLFSSGFSRQHPVRSSPLPHTCYMPRPSHSSWFYKPHNIGWVVQIIKLLIIQFPPLPCYLVPLKPKYSPQNPILEHPQPVFLPQYQWPSFTPMQSPRLRLCLWIFRNKIRFHGEELLTPHPTPKLEDHPLSAVHDCLFNIFAATLHIGGCSSICNLRTCHAVVTGTHLSYGMLYLMENTAKVNVILLSNKHYLFLFIRIQLHIQISVYTFYYLC